MKGSDVNGRKELGPSATIFFCRAFPFSFLCVKKAFPVRDDVIGRGRWRNRSFSCFVIVQCIALVVAAAATVGDGKSNSSRK